MALFGDFQIETFKNGTNHYIDNFNFVFLFLLSRINDNKTINLKEFKSYLIEKQNTINSVGSLIKAVQEFNIPQTDEELIYYFDIHLVHHYLNENNIQKIEDLLRENFTFSKFQVEENNHGGHIYYEIKDRIISFIFYFSLEKRSIDAFNLYSQIKKIFPQPLSDTPSHKFIFNSEFQTSFRLITTHDLEKEKELLNNYFNLILTEESINLLPVGLKEIIPKIVLSEDASQLEYIIKNFAPIREEYLLLLLEGTDRIKMIEGHFKSKNSMANF
ncbi:hypothetical protein DICPUDRAFT_152067 [Dictyostelium purpureum]|uniref:Uncharacterized protein n=1 Tax=Dictyostelium purpureum TaxID=5786 RepID=F0ZKE1_DICPU|nr:uncharacterized protein DICPUDRAFT_152067 [Dictyostelium purpureum]EGC35577.1 hypothetical protein DICPUDRAFT_152067 [Dictyostelium purpureum]|eukprot:XP_003287880.1 hypothetical protein DICPUDRAFT_152067 [Dictyostelium purpureum]